MRIFALVGALALGLATSVSAATLTETKLTASDGASGDWFGISVAISGTTAIIGASGDGDHDQGSEVSSAYLFDTTTGHQIAKLTTDTGTSGDEFGSSVAISGTTALVGAVRDDGFTGAAYLFDITTGIQIAKLTASDGAGGTALAIPSRSPAARRSSGRLVPTV